ARLAASSALHQGGARAFQQVFNRLASFARRPPPEASGNRPRQRDVDDFEIHAAIPLTRMPPGVDPPEEPMIFAFGPGALARIVSVPQFANTHRARRCLRTVDVGPEV